MRWLALLALLAHAAATAPLAPAPWPVEGHDSGKSFYLAGAYLLPKYCSYKLESGFEDYKGPEQYQVIAPDVIASSDIFSDNVLTHYYSNISASVKAEDIGQYLGGTDNIRLIGFAANGSQVMYLAGCVEAALVLYAFPLLYAGGAIWIAETGITCNRPWWPHYNTFENAIDLFANGSYLLRADASSGKLLWTVSLSPNRFSYLSSPFLLSLSGGDVLLTGATNGSTFLEMYNGNDGSVRWTAPTTELGTNTTPSCIGALAVDGIVVAHCGDDVNNVVTARSVATGVVLWTRTLACAANQFLSARALVSLNDTSYLAISCAGENLLKDPNNINVIDLTSGDVLYKTTLKGADLVTSMTGVGRHVIVSAYNSVMTVVASSATTTCLPPADPVILTLRAK